MLLPSLAADRNSSLLRLYSARLGTMVNRRLSKVALDKTGDDAVAAPAPILPDARLPFLKAMSGHLAAPLSSLVGCAEEMLDGAHGPIMPAYQDHVRYIVELGRQLLTAVSDVVDAARIDVDDDRRDEHDLDVPRLITALLPLFEIDAAEAGVHLGAQMPGDLPPLRADPRAVRLVIAALLHEALAHTPSGGRIIVGAAIEPGGALNLSLTRSGAAAGEAPPDAATQALIEKLLARHDAFLLRQAVPGLGAVTAMVFPASRAVSRANLRTEVSQES